MTDPDQRHLFGIWIIRAVSRYNDGRVEWDGILSKLNPPTFDCSSKSTKNAVKSVDHASAEKLVLHLRHKLRDESLDFSIIDASAFYN